MSKVRNKDSKIEISLRKMLWAKGFRYRKNSTKYYGKPDIIVAKYKTVIFMDSCFWHKCPKHYKAPTTRAKFWEEKITNNKIRDKKVNRHYKKEGWKIIRIWEHQPIQKSIHRIDKILLNNQ